MESPATPQTTLSQLESHLWEAANILHGPVDAANFKTYVFPLFVFKRISDVHDQGRINLLLITYRLSALQLLVVCQRHSPQCFCLS